MRRPSLNLVHRVPRCRPRAPARSAVICGTDDLVCPGRARLVSGGLQTRSDLIEGAELQALEGMRSTLGRAGEVTMFVEVNPPLLAVGGAEEVEAWLREEGFEVAYIDLAAQRPVPLPTPRRKGHLLATRHV